MKLLKMSSNAIFPQVISLVPNKAKKKLELAVNTYLAIYFEGLLCFNNSFVKYLEQLINELMVRKISNDIALTRNEIINIGTRYGTISFSCKTSCSNKYSGLWYTIFNAVSIIIIISSVGLGNIKFLQVNFMRLGEAKIRIMMIIPNI